MFCLLLGHVWFDTVLTEAPFEHYGPHFDYAWCLGLFRERVCTCCGKQEAVWVRDIDKWQGSMYNPYPPKWSLRAPAHFPLET